MKEKDYSVFAERLKKLLDERNISQAELARKFETTTTTVFRWTKGNSKPHKEVVKSIAIFLGVRFEYLNGDDDFKNEDAIMDDYISRDKLIESVDNADYTEGQYFLTIKLIEQAPNEDVAPVVHGKWNRAKYLWGWECDQCGKSVFSDRKSALDRYKYPFCPGCGAKMDGEKKGVNDGN